MLPQINTHPPKSPPPLSALQEIMLSHDQLQLRTSIMLGQINFNHACLYKLRNLFMIPNPHVHISKPVVPRNVPLGALISVVLVTGVYMLTNISYFTVMSPQELLDSSAVASVSCQHFILHRHVAAGTT